VPTRIIITGDRKWSPTLLVGRIVDRLVARYGADLVIVHGAGEGIDQAFDAACRMRGVSVESHPARWDELDAPDAMTRKGQGGKSYNSQAGPARNQEMVDAGASLAIACHRSLAWSRGTLDCVQRCRRAGIRVYLFDSEDSAGRPLGAADLTKSARMNFRASHGDCGGTS
jgi:YspA, cpYpsA-related SLOG family